ncbi:dUTP diphosphatase [Aristophania vespae]|uniref:Deoxyuridine 5'-triphosphate nucleotidohydrolase n=1 Tax=Aristophania vespae TaxID=2697033 RepID=A0A6P1NDH8_9PROT|nr:dUTP diphosphatase [Aristophania vespae]QHI95568.1 dUTP diphosphatase [Aristophania vespae]UMM63228.1 Deoxyuridine 5'-triphosphate nucleotidohydrolase [Aristophania vespae]
MDSHDNSSFVKVNVVTLPHFEGLDLPHYATSGAAGVDFVAAITDSVTLKAGERTVIPTGLKAAIPAGYELQIRPRSGLALKHGIMLPNTPGTIDEDYRGEIGIIIMNGGSEPFTIERGMRIAQGILAPVVRLAWQICETLDDTQRGEKGFGSTGHLKRS